MSRVLKALMVGGLVLSALGLGAHSFANEAASPREANENPYIELYVLRVSQAEANLRRREALATLADARFVRAQRLLQQNAIAREEYDTLSAEKQAASAEKDLASQKVDEAKAYLRIIEGLVARGVTIPICTYEME